MTYEQRLRDYEYKKRKLIREFSIQVKGNKRISLGKSTSNLFRHRKNSKSTLNVRNFNKVILVDRKNKIVEAEGMTTYEELVKQTLKYGYTPTVVPELKSITLGGAVTGVGIESSSFKYGLVHETVTEIEVLLGNGSTVLCTPTNEHKDLFFGFPNSYGTLGYALKLKVKIISVKKYVKLTHLKFDNVKKYVKKLQEVCQKKELFDFIDGTIFSKHELYITLGQYTDKALKVSNYKYMNIYYLSIKEKHTDYLTISDYIWRWDADWFWCSKHFGAQNKVLRLLLGKWMLTSKVYWKIRAWNNRYRLAEKLRGVQNVESVIQDVEIPIEHSEEFITFFHKEIGITPIWVCPVQNYNKKVEFELYKMDSSKLYLNFGFWEVIKTTHEDGYYNKRIETKVKELKGKKSLYSTSFYTKKEFWSLYNQKKYDLLKTKYDRNHVFRDLYEKCVTRK